MSFTFFRYMQNSDAIDYKQFDVYTNLYFFYNPFFIL